MMKDESPGPSCAGSPLAYPGCVWLNVERTTALLDPVDQFFMSLEFKRHRISTTSFASAADMAATLNHGARRSGADWPAEAEYWLRKNTRSLVRIRRTALGRVLPKELRQ
jgi:hypothetical protein